MDPDKTMAGGVMAHEADLKAPSKPFMTDEYGPTDAKLWERVIEVARGDRREMTLNERTIHSPNRGRGFRHWPNPKAIAWAVKQYNGFNGGWKKSAASGFRLLAQTRLSGIVATQEATQEHVLAEGLQEQGLVALDRVQGGWHYWAATYKGARLVRAGLGEELRRKMDDLLVSFDAGKAKALGEWFDANFRVSSPKTPKGGKELKDRAQRLVWVLKHRIDMSADADATEKARAEIESDWRLIEPHLSQFVAGFTDEGGKVVPKEIVLDGVTFVNEVGVDETSVEKYAKRLTAIFNSVHGWRSKALKGGLKVVLSSPRNFNGTAGGKYKTNEDALYVRATPTVLKRDGGYGSFEYIIVHELGHRFERFNSVPDFDKAEWRTTRYSSKEGESFAELFALGHFNYTGTWDQAIVERFEKVMEKA